MTIPRWLSVALRLAGTAAGLAWIATKVELHDAADALARISPATFAVAIALVAANVVAGALRWRVLMRGYGAARIPPRTRLVYLYFVAFFYNNYLPGAVAGDVGRGIVMREAFGESATGSLAVVLVERALGLFALFALLALGLVGASAALDTGSLWIWTALGLTGSLGLVVALPIGKRLAPALPGALGRIAGRLPTLVDRSAFALAIGYSLATQALIALAGWVLLDAAYGGAMSVAASLLVVPLAAATTFLPITVGGAGAREAVYVALCAQLFGMPEADALAASLGLWLAHLVVGGAGGLVQLTGGRARRAGRAPAPPR